MCQILSGFSKNQKVQTVQDVAEEVFSVQLLTDLKKKKKKNPTSVFYFELQK